MDSYDNTDSGLLSGSDIDENELNDDDLEYYSGPETFDELYAGAEPEDKETEPSSQATVDTSITQRFGDFSFEPREFCSQTSAPDFDGTRALALLQRRMIIDYGKQGARATLSDSYEPTFKLDMISIVGKPLRPIVARSNFFDNVTFSLQHWHASYTSKHVATSLPFKLHGRTFRIATGASRELWFIVMQPIRTELVELPDAARRHRAKRESSTRGTAVQRHHAEALALYIKSIFLDGELMGEGVEPSWGLNKAQSQSLSYDKWETFQRLFMGRWAGFIELNSHDEFWTDNRPAFHSYDHGANIEIKVGEGALERLPLETCLRRDEDVDKSSSSESEAGEGDEGSEGSWNGFDDESGVAEDSETPETPSPASSSQPDEELGPLMPSDTELAFYSLDGGLEGLRHDLENKYLLSNIEQISYALAADINCTGRDGAPSTVCLLSDRRKIARQYRSEREFTFYPLAFHPRYGNFSSSRPPNFLNNLCTIMQDNMSFQNKDLQVLSFGFFQGYSNIKRAIRNRPEDLLATRGIATAALTLPPSEASATSGLQAKHRRLLHALRGGHTPADPETSRPFAREGRRLEDAINSKQLTFRMEQVVTVKVSSLTDRRCHFYTVLQPIFQLMRFFLCETKLYVPVLRGFAPSVFPGMLCSYARLFDAALREMDSRYQARGDKGLTVALAEAVAVLDRLGNFCFTGDPRVLPKAVLRPLLTMQSLEASAWPYVDPAMLEFQTERGDLDEKLWPRTANGRPMLLHMSALALRYGETVAANRHSDIWFGELETKSIRDTTSALLFLEDVFRSLWVPQMTGFMAQQLRRQCGIGARRLHVPASERMELLKDFKTDVEAWEDSNEPFGNRHYEKLFTYSVRTLVDGEGSQPRTVSEMSRYDHAAALYRACRPRKGKKAMTGSIAPVQSTWATVVRSAVQHTDDDAVSEEQWIANISSAMATVGIDWVPGARDSKLTSRRVVRLVGQKVNRQILTAPPKSLKRSAMVAQLEMSSQRSQPSRRSRRVIDLGYEIPYQRVPPVIVEAFRAELKDISRDEKRQTANHYQVAYECLVDGVGDQLCDLMLILVMTLMSSTATPQVSLGHSVFTASTKRKDPKKFAVALITRMMWYLRPGAFPKDHIERGVLPISKMIDKTQARGISLKMLIQLGWLVVTGPNRNDRPRTEAVALRSKEDLFYMYKTLESIMRRDAQEFLEKIFGSTDGIWIERCSSIIKIV